MRKLLLQLDSSRLPSVFDRVVAYDAGADEIMSYGGVAESDVRDLIHGAIFTRGPKDLRNTAVFIGGADIAAGQRLLDAAREAFFGPFRVSLMLDSNGSNTTAVAAVMKILETIGAAAGARIVITAGTGPVGSRAAGILAAAGAEVLITSRRAEDGDKVAASVKARFGGTVRASVTPQDPAAARTMVRDADVLLNAGPAGVQLVAADAWAAGTRLKVAVDLNAVPPLGIAGIEATDAGVVRNGVKSFGAIGVGNVKMKVHKTCVARLFDRNDRVLDAETIAEVGRELLAGAP